MLIEPPTDEARQALDRALLDALKARLDGASAAAPDAEAIALRDLLTTADAGQSALLRAVWGYRAPQAANTRTLDSHACRLRGKLGAAGAGALIQNVWGVGYRLLDPDLTGTIA